MNQQFKGLNLFGLIITTKASILDAKISIEPEEIWNLFKQAVKERKIIIQDTVSK